MKWLPRDGSVQHSADKRFCIVQANSRDWIAYRMGPTSGEEIGVKSTDEDARKVCEDHEKQRA